MITFDFLKDTIVGMTFISALPLVNLSAVSPSPAPLVGPSEVQTILRCGGLAVINEFQVLGAHLSLQTTLLADNLASAEYQCGDYWNAVKNNEMGMLDNTVEYLDNLSKTRCEQELEAKQNRYQCPPSKLFCGGGADECARVSSGSCSLIGESHIKVYDDEIDGPDYLLYEKPNSPGEWVCIVGHAWGPVAIGSGWVACGDCLPR